MAKPKATPPFDLESSIPAMVNALQACGALKKTELKAFMVPPALQEAVLARLVAAGFEPMTAGVRVPLRQQLQQLLRQRPVLGWPPGKLLKGGTPKEYKALASELARAGELQLLVRGKAEAVAGPEVPALTREELRTLGLLALSVQKALKAKPLPRTLLRADLRELLLDLLEPAGAGAPAQAVKPRPELVDLLVLEAGRRLEPGMGLCFVPGLVLACLGEHSLTAVHAALFQAVRDGRLELRPESGMDSLSALELGLCPPGLQDTRLSWARPLEPRP